MEHRAVLVEINLKSTHLPGSEPYQEIFLSDKDEWVEAVWLGSGDDEEIVMLLHGEYRGQITSAWEMRDAGPTLVRRLLDKVRDLEQFISINYRKLKEKTTLDLEKTTLFLEELKQTKAVRSKVDN